MDTMSDFQKRMKKLASNLSPESREIVSQVLSAEHQKRFSDRTNLPDEFATKALQIAKPKES